MSATTTEVKKSTSYIHRTRFRKKPSAITKRQRVVIIESSDEDIDDIPVLMRASNSDQIGVVSSSFEEEDSKPEQEKNWGPIKRNDIVLPDNSEIIEENFVIEEENHPIESDVAGQTQVSNQSAVYSYSPIFFGALRCPRVYLMTRKKTLFINTQFLLKLNKGMSFLGIPSNDNRGKGIRIQYDDGQRSMYCGFLRIHEGGKRYTLFSTQPKPNDDREAEIMGIYLLSKSHGNKCFRIASLPYYRPHYPISKRLNLSLLAKDLDSVSGFQYQVCTNSCNNSQNSIPSAKNLTIYFEGECMYAINKASENEFTVNTGKDLYPFACAGLSFAILNS